jgi:hypothetical protein
MDTESSHQPSGNENGRRDADTEEGVVGEGLGKQGLYGGRVDEEAQASCWDCEHGD